ncbi:MAG: tetratricopeptide repeat protein [Dermatophilaceae bacterium]
MKTFRAAVRRAAGVSVAAGLVVMGASACTSDDEPSSPTSTSASASADPAGTQVARLLQDGIGFAQNNQLDQASTTFTNVLTLDPDNKFALYNLGLLAQTRKDTRGALTFYDRALAADPNYRPALYNKAIVLEATDIDQSIALYERITAADPKASTAWFRLSISYGAQGDDAKAKQARDKALALDPSLASAPTSTAPAPGSGVAPKRTASPSPSSSETSG